jgi:phospholipid-binding lipoprotein MlaA
MKLVCPPAARAIGMLVVAAALVLLGGCAAVTQPDPRDPLERLNRGTHAFNDGVDKVVLKPVATVYRDKVPSIMRTGVSNFFGNLGDAWSAVNSLLQFRLQEAEENLARFQLNTMFGVFGIFDIASDANIERHRADFGQTLGRWGVPAGPYLVLPLLGPSTLRDAVALPVDWRYDIISSFRPYAARNATYALRAVDTRANLLRISSVLEEAALDQYSFVRDAYLQRRRAEIDRNRGNEDRDVPPPLPDYDDEPAPANPAAPPAAVPAAPPGQPAPAPAR